MFHRSLPCLILLAMALAAGAKPAAPQPRTGADAALIAAITAQTTDFTTPEPFEDRPGGAATARSGPPDQAFSQPLATIGFETEPMFRQGKAVFNKIWVAAPAKTTGSDGLGPLFVARSCQACHIRDGRSPPPGEGIGPAAMAVFLSLPDLAGGTDLHWGAPTRPDPVYGSQLQPFATSGQPAEFQLGLRYENSRVTLAGGQQVALRRPVYSVEHPGYGPLGAGAMLSPRVAPPMIGLGLLAAIPDQDILAHADPLDRNGDGVSGRPNWAGAPGAQQLGRFGHKAAVPDLLAQTALAFSGDMGLSTPLRPAVWGDCTAAQVACRAAPDGSGPQSTDGSTGASEVSATTFAQVAFYAQSLGPPARPAPGNADVLRGKALFYAAGCTACHVPKYVTARLPDEPDRSFQLIWPYSDLLLHDMGAGLADNRPEGRATGTEWRTAPLWGLGHTLQVSGQQTYLHDGRARSVLEAILWHGGEAAMTRSRITQMPAPDRADLLRFLASL